MWPSSPYGPMRQGEDADSLDGLFWEIVKCRHVEECLQVSMGNHPCQTLVHAQENLPLNDRQVPEPWSGDIAHVPILFIGSNPGYNPKEPFPTLSWTEGQTRSFFRDRLRNEQPWRQYKNEVRERATELLGRDVVPHRDYALSEAVHCKSSKQREGVWEASETCANLYLSRVVEQAGARLIVCLGKVARQEVLRVFPGIPPAHLEGGTTHGPLEIGGGMRWFTFLRFSRFRGEPKAAYAPSPDELQLIRKVVGEPLGDP